MEEKGGRGRLVGSKGKTIEHGRWREENQPSTMGPQKGIFLQQIAFAMVLYMDTRYNPLMSKSKKKTSSKGATTASSKKKQHVYFTKSNKQVVVFVEKKQQRGGYEWLYYTCVLLLYFYKG